MFKGNEIRIVKISLHSHVHHSIVIHNNQDVETTHVSFSRWVHQERSLQVIITRSVVEREYENNLLC